MREERMSKLKIGLVLAGGGAKGAYETGVLRTLWELNLTEHIHVISGTSIGSVNAALFAMNNQKVMKDSWSQLSYSRFIKNQENVRNVLMNEIKSKVKKPWGEKTICDQVAINDQGLLSQNGVREFITEYVDLKAIRTSSRDIYACAYNIDQKCPKYFRLKDYEPEEILDIILASCAIPLMFPPITINGERYADGGIHMNDYGDNPVDNVPIHPLKESDCNVILVVHLSNKSEIDRSGLEHAKIIEIYPSQPLEMIQGIGTVVLKSSTLNNNIELGYRDSMTVLAPMLVAFMQGLKIEPYLLKQEDRNKKLRYKKRRRENSQSIPARYVKAAIDRTGLTDRKSREEGSYEL